MNCDCCGRFHDHGPGSACKMVYSGWPPTPDREITRCRACVEKYGPFNPQSNIDPKYGCGIVTKKEEKTK